MKLSMNSSVENRKALVTRLGELTGIKPHYDGVPGCSYTIGAYKVLKDGSVETEEGIDGILQTLGAEGFIDLPETEPEQTEETQPEEQEDTVEVEETAQPEDIDLTVEIPLDQVAVGNLTKLLDAKGSLIKKALGIEDIGIEVKEDRVAFPWFKDTPPENAMAYSKFIAALCKMAKEAKRVTATEKEVENEKYAFRCFLLRLGFIGAEYKQDRKILLQNLSGSSAFRSGERKEAADDAVSE
jgi:hypothetical protein